MSIPATEVKMSTSGQPEQRTTGIRRSFLRRAATAVIAVVGITGCLSFFSLPGSVLSAQYEYEPVRTPDKPSEPGPFGAPLASGSFLVASRSLGDPRFRETVVLLIGYGSGGAAGLIINRPTEIALSEMLPEVTGIGKSRDVVYYGGPVEGDRILMLVRAAAPPKNSDRVFNDVYVSASRSTLERLLARPKKGERFRVYVGYAGWAPGQLDGEVSRGDWYVVKGDAKTIFEKDHGTIWPELIRKSAQIHVRHSRAVEQLSRF